MSSLKVPPNAKKKAKSKIFCFVVLTLLFSSISWYTIISAGSMEKAGFLAAVGVMWCPGLAALLTQLLFNRNLRGFGWRWGKTKYQLLSWAIPLFYCLVIYGSVWATGLGGFPDQAYYAEEIAAPLAELGISTQSPVAGLAIMILLYTVAGLFFFWLALGEEIAWRGLLVAELRRITSFRNTALIIGVMMTLWHFPLFFLAGYHGKSPLWFGVICATLSIIAVSYLLLWLRLKSGSLWTAVLFHTSHNFYVQDLFTPVTADTGVTPYIIGEFGVAIPIVLCLLAYLAWRKRGDLLPAPASWAPSSAPNA